jgi:hypothetical protein
MEQKPVFVDVSGWRRSVLRWTGMAVAGLLAAYLVVVGNALISSVSVPRVKLPHKTLKTKTGTRHRANRADRVSLLG